VPGVRVRVQRRRGSGAFRRTPRLVERSWPFQEKPRGRIDSTSHAASAPTTSTKPPLPRTSSSRTVAVPSGVATVRPRPGASTLRTVATMTRSAGSTRRTMNSSATSSRKPAARSRALAAVREHPGLEFEVLGDGVRPLRGVLAELQEERREHVTARGVPRDDAEPAAHAPGELRGVEHVPERDRSLPVRRRAVGDPGEKFALVGGARREHREVADGAGERARRPSGAHGRAGPGSGRRPTQSRASRGGQRGRPAPAPP